MVIRRIARSLLITALRKWGGAHQTSNHLILDDFFRFSKKSGFGVLLVHPPMASVLLSASVERCFVSCMRDFSLNFTPWIWHWLPWPCHNITLGRGEGVGWYYLIFEQPLIRGNLAWWHHWNYSWVAMMTEHQFETIPQSSLPSPAQPANLQHYPRPSLGERNILQPGPSCKIRQWVLLCWVVNL